jgi:hypothetical protein
VFLEIKYAVAKKIVADEPNHFTAAEILARPYGRNQIKDTAAEARPGMMDLLRVCENIS